MHVSIIDMSFEAVRLAYLLLPIMGGVLLQGVCMRFDWLRTFRRPIDLGLRFRSHRIFGENKTFRGLVCGTAGTASALALQAEVLHDYHWFASLEYFDYQTVNPLEFGLLLGLAAMLSELPNSFLKRRLGIAEGAAGTTRSFVVFYFLDQTDFLVGTWLVLATVVEVTVSRVFGSIVLVLAIHPLITVMGYVLRIRRTIR